MKKLTFEHALDKLRNFQSLITEFNSLAVRLDEITTPRVTTGAFNHIGTGNTEYIHREPERIAEQREFILNQFDRCTEEIKKEKDYIFDLIKLADPYELQSVLRFRYIYGESIKFTAEHLNVNPSTIKRKTKQGIESIVENYNKNMC